MLFFQSFRASISSANCDSGLKSCYSRSVRLIAVLRQPLHGFADPGWPFTWFGVVLGIQGDLIFSTRVMGQLPRVRQVGGVSCWSRGGRHCQVGWLLHPTLIFYYPSVSITICDVYPEHNDKQCHRISLEKYRARNLVPIYFVRQFSRSVLKVFRFSDHLWVRRIVASFTKYFLV